MDRRNFGKNILLTGLAAPAVLAGFSRPASSRDGGRNGPPPFGRVELRLPGQTVTVDYFAILTGDGPYGVDLRPNVPQMAAERIDLGSVPLLGRLLTPTVRRQFAGATGIGTLHLINRTVFLLPDIALPAVPRRLRITHRNVVYRPPSSIRPLRLKSPPALEQARTTARIGTSVLRDETILAIVPPSALDDLEFALPAPA